MLLFMIFSELVYVCLLKSCIGTSESRLALPTSLACMTFQVAQAFHLKCCFPKFESDLFHKYLNTDYLKVLTPAFYISRSLFMTMFS